MATKKRKANVVDTTAELRAQMKKNNVRLPHGYDVVKRKPVAKKATPKKGKVSAKSKSKAPSKKGINALKKINAEAKKIRKYDPSISWIDAVKLAAKK